MAGSSPKGSSIVKSNVRTDHIYSGQPLNRFSSPVLPDTMNLYVAKINHLHSWGKKNAAAPVWMLAFLCALVSVSGTGFSGHDSPVIVG